MADIKEAVEDLQAEGYEPWFNPIDAEVAAEEKHCGLPMKFSGWQAGESKVALAYCRKCGDYYEF